jgi:diguanylate cyclase (GGDEF)-like protein
VITFLGLFVLLMAAWLGWRHERRSQEMDETRLLAEQVAYRFGREVDIHMTLAAMVKDRLESQEVIGQDQFLEAVSHVQRHFSSFAAIAFLTPEMTAQWMIPEGSFLLGGLSLFDQPMQHELMLRAFVEQRPVISPPLRGTEAAALLVAYVPVFSQGRFAGYLSSILRLDVLLEKLLREGFLHYYMVRVIDQSSGLIVFSNAVDEENTRFVDAPISVADRHFLVELASNQDQAWLLLPLVALPCAVVLALLPAMLVYQRTLHGMAMYRQKERFKEMADMLPEMVLELRNDRAQRWPISYMNKAARRALSSRGDVGEDDEGLSLFEVAHVQSYEELDKRLHELQQGDPAQVLRMGDLQLYRANAAITFPAELIAMAIRNKEAAGEVVGFRCVIRDKTADIENQRKLEQAATQDTLTGLPNRSLFYDRLEQAMGRARREGTRVAVLFCDLDKFKQVNDTLGHHAGDELLRQVAKRMKEAVRKTDTVARLAGDEFVFIIEGLGGTGDALPTVDEVCSKIIHHVSETYVLGGSHPVRIGLSIGISIFPDHGESVDELLINADHSMYRVKASGGNAFRMDVAC